MSKLVKIEIFSLVTVFLLASGSAFYSYFPGCVASDSFGILSKFLVFSLPFIMVAIFATLDMQDNI